MLKLASRDDVRRQTHKRIRRRLRGAQARPRLVIFRSASHIYAQIVDDSGARTLASASTLDKELRKTVKSGGNVAAAKAVGQAIAARAKTAGVLRVVFDRGGYAYHGRIKALADAAREAGLQF